MNEFARVARVEAVGGRQHGNGFHIPIRREGADDRGGRVAEDEGWGGVVVAR